MDNKDGGKGVTQSCIYFHARKDNAVRKFEISDTYLYWDSQITESGNRNGPIGCRNVLNILFDNVTVFFSSKCIDQIYIYDIQSCTDSKATFRECKMSIIGTSTSVVKGILVSGASEIRDCTFISLKSGLEITRSASTKVEVENCQFMDLSGYGIYVGSSAGSVTISLKLCRFEQKDTGNAEPFMQFDLSSSINLIYCCFQELKTQTKSVIKSVSGSSLTGFGNCVSQKSSEVALVGISFAEAGECWPEVILDCSFCESECQTKAFSSTGKMSRTNSLTESVDTVASVCLGSTEDEFDSSLGLTMTKLPDISVSFTASNGFSMTLLAKSESFSDSLQLSGTISHSKSEDALITKNLSLSAYIYETLSLTKSNEVIATSGFSSTNSFSGTGNLDKTAFLTNTESFSSISLTTTIDELTVSKEGTITSPVVAPQLSVTTSQNLGQGTLDLHSEKSENEGSSSVSVYTVIPFSVVPESPAVGITSRSTIPGSITSSALSPFVLLTESVILGPESGQAEGSSFSGGEGAMKSEKDGDDTVFLGPESGQAKGSSFSGGEGAMKSEKDGDDTVFLIVAVLGMVVLTVLFGFLIYKEEGKKKKGKEKQTREVQAPETKATFGSNGKKK
jgi:preprotein translocase subunit SecG